MKRIFVTGANGYIGSWLSRACSDLGNVVVAGSREPISRTPETRGIANAVYGDLRGSYDWVPVLSGIDVLVHTAGFVHKKAPLSDSDREDAYALNAVLVENIAKAAIQAGVKKIVLISTIAVHGSGGGGAPVNELAPIRPENSYARSKLGGENKLIDCCRKSSMAWVIIRPVMVYGPDCPGNFAELVRAVRTRIPLPLKNIRNTRSFIFIENLIDLLVSCIENPAAQNEIFVAADPEPVSVPQVILWIAEALGTRPALWPFPVNLMRAFANVTGMGPTFSSLVDDFVVDAKKAENVLGWRPGFDTRSGILQSVS